MPATATAADAATVDPALFRAVMRRFATGVTVISHRRADGTPAGMTANAFLSVSMTPPLVLVSVRRQSAFNGQVGLGDGYGVNFLAEHQQHLSAHFGGRRDERLQPPFFASPGGVPLLQGSLAHAVARVVDIHPAGDHLLVIGEIEHLACGAEAPPLIFYGGAYKQLHAHEPPVHWQGTGDGW
ncbi:MAG: flavin reductase family protein [Proteobacteria bacterium]|nr:flavin reductase family protein [Pseudomonadota bacterium]